MASVASTNGQSSVRMIELEDFDDFEPRDRDAVSQLIQDALIDLGYENVASFSWSVRVWFEPNKEAA